LADLHSGRKTPSQVFLERLLVLFEKAVKDRDPSRESLMQIPLGPLNRSLLSGDITVTRQIIERQLDRMLRLILQEDDFELFKTTISLLATSLVIEDLTQLALHIDASIYEAVRLFKLDPAESQNRKNINSLRFILSHGSGKRFDSILTMPQRLAQLRPSSLADVKDFPLKETMDQVLRFYANSLLLRIFFLASVNVLFEYSQQRIDAGTYLTELWHYTRPEDADAIILNVTPVPTDPVWLTLLYLYGGIGSRLWYENYYFRDFHGTAKYVRQSYLLGLAKIGKPILPPSPSELKDLAEVELWREMGELYEFIDDFLTETSSESFRRELKELPKLQLDAFITRGRPIRLEMKEQSWYDDLNRTIEEARKGFSTAMETITAYLPLDEKKKEECITTIENTYLKESVVDGVAVPAPCDIETERSLKTFSNRFPTVPKNCLLGPARVYCNLIWDEIGRDIATQETRYILDVALNVVHPSTTVDGYNPDQIWNTLEDQVSQMIRAQNKPNLAFVPLPLLMDWTKGRKVSFAPEETLILSDAQLKVVHSWKKLPFKDILVVNKSLCKWPFQMFDGKRLRTCIIAETSTVRIDVQSRGMFIPQPEGIRIIKLPACPSTVT